MTTMNSHDDEDYEGAHADEDYGESNISERPADAILRMPLRATSSAKKHAETYGKKVIDMLKDNRCYTSPEDADDLHAIQRDLPSRKETKVSYTTSFPRERKVQRLVPP
jgi:hypothetical protein